MLLLRTSRGVDPGIPLLRSLGSNAHVWLPGANGTTVASLPSNNYLLSDGSTGYSTVDGVVGLDLDGMGALSSTERLSNGDFSSGSTGWSLDADWTVSGGAAVFLNTGGSRRLISSAGVVGGLNTFVKVRFDVTALPATGILDVLCGATTTALTINSVGPYSFFLKVVTNEGFRVTARVGISCTVDNISVKEYTGTHLTQATSANKPLVRRGSLNLLTYSQVLDHANWLKSGLTATADQTTAPDGTLTADSLLGIGALSLTYQSAFSTGTYSLSCYAKAGSASEVKLSFSFALNGREAAFNLSAGTAGAVYQLGTGGSVAGGTSRIVAVGNGWYRCIIEGMILSGSNSFVLTIANGAQIYIWGAQLEQSATAGDYTLTTATAASNPSAGKYWWSFDGSNDSLLSGNLGITNACTIVIAGRVNSLATTHVLFAEDTTGLAFYIEATTGIVIASKNGTSQLVYSTGFPVTAGVPFVLTFRLSSGTAVIRRNGVQVATAGTALTFAATTGARIGSDFAGTSYLLNGALGWVVPLPVALSDAECLTIERLVGSQFPGMASF